MSKVYEFAISRKLAIVLAVCCALAGILLFAAGTLSGWLLFPQYAAYARPKAKIEVAATAIPAKPISSGTQQSGGTTPSAAPATAGATQPAAPGPTPAPDNAPKSEALAQPLPAAEAGKSVSGGKQGASLVPVAGKSQPAPAASSGSGAAGAASAGATAEAGAPAKAAAPPPPDPYAVSLVVQVGSFTVEANAKRLAESLQQLGYPAEIVERTDSHQRLWHVVRLGPYREWNAATGVATRLALNQELKPIVGPM
jgi:sporulation related protein